MKREREEGIEDKRKIYIGGMPFHYDEAGIREFWEYCGEVSEVDLMTFPDTGRFRGIAIVTFATEAGAEEALQHDGGDCEGKRLVVKRYQKSGRGATPAKR